MENKNIIKFRERIKEIENFINACRGSGVHLEKKVHSEKFITNLKEVEKELESIQKEFELPPPRIMGLLRQIRGMISDMEETNRDLMSR